MARSTPVAGETGLVYHTAEGDAGTIVIGSADWGDWLRGTQPFPILVTKLFLPHPPPGFIARPRLTTRLEAGLRGRLTLVSAPAGFGKTTLVSSWIDDLRLTIADGSVEAARQDEIVNPQSKIVNHAAWLSLDEGDNDAARFLAYLVAALQTVAPTVGQGVLAALHSPQPPPTESILTALLNEIASLPDRFVLVLDDYHLIDDQAIDLAIAFLLDNLPPQLHVVITTREDPQLPLARYRARGQLTELRAADLRFTPAEAADFLNHAMGLSLSAADIAALEDRTEGWVAGLQLAALSMRGREDVRQFVTAFAGDHRYIVDYLVEEVLRRQPERVRRFLLQTSILDRLSGPLCDAVLDERQTTDDGRQRADDGELTEPSSRLLEHLERANLFLIPLDDQRQWYRYHHLFADVLQAHLRAEQPDQVPPLHRRASAWYEQQGSAADAIRHALAADDFAHAAGLVELAWSAMRRSRQDATLLGWLKALPGRVLRCRPVLNVAYAHVLLSSGAREGVEERLRNAERWLDTTAAEGARPDGAPEAMVVVDDEALSRLRGSIAIARAGLALARGDVAGTMTHARQALDLAPADDHMTRGGAAGFLGLALWTRGELEAAHQTYAEGMASLHRAGNVSDAINGAVTLCAIRVAQGRLREAMRTYERGLRLATEGGGPVLRGAGDMHVGMSELHREHNHLHEAEQHLLRSQELGEHTGFPQNRYRWYVAMARLREAQGDAAGALDLLDEAERLYMSDFSPHVRPIAALKARVWVTQGRLGEAFDWARGQGVSAHDDLGYGREFEHITLARLLLARYQHDGDDGARREAVGLLERLRQAAEAGERGGSVIEILALQALAHQTQGNTSAALVALERALTLAQPEGYVRLFVDEGQPMAELLTRMKEEGGRLREYRRTLLAAFGEPADVHPSSFIPHPLVEPLSEREREVLRLLATDLSGPDLARELVVSLNTVRTHIKNIYGKLGVNNRRAAVRRAEELHLM